MIRRTPYAIFLLLPILLGTTCSSESPPIVGQAEIQISQYEYHFNMESREARATLSIQLLTAGDCFTLPMRSEGLLAPLIDGEPALSAIVDNGNAKICGVGWPEMSEISFSTTTRVALDTWDNSQVGYSVSDDIEGNPFTYMVSWVGGCDRFGPCDSAASTFATYKFTVDHPSGHQVLCPGTITSTDTQTICEFTHDGGPTYSSFGFAASPSWNLVDMGDWGGIAVSFYDMPSAGLAAKVNVEEHKDFTAWMAGNFGPYPYGDELRFAVGPTFWNGFEHPGNILLNDRLSTGGLGSAYSNPLAHTISHEIAHQWAGDQTTLSGTYDFVWKEAMAEYLVFVHKEEKISETRAIRTLRAWKTFSRNSDFYLVPNEKPPLIEYYGDVYGPGPMILFRQLEAIFDRASIMKALTNLLGQERAIGIEDVQKALEEATSSDLENYFESWVHGQGAPSWPRFAVTTEDVAGGVLVKVSQSDSDKDLFGCAFTIALLGTDDGQSVDLRVNLGVDGMALWTGTANPNFEVQEFRFDTKHECLGTLASAKAAVRPDKKYNPMVAPAFQ